MAQAKKMSETSVKPDFLDVDHDGNTEEPFKQAVKDQELDEKAPHGAKAERMVKHIKKGYAKDGELTDKEKSIAYATAWKASKAGKLKESGASDELWDLAKGDIDPEEIKKLAQMLADGKITLDDFNDRIEDLTYTGYSMRKGEMGHDWNKANFDEDQQLSELDKSTLKSYTKAAAQDLVDKTAKLGKTDSSKKQAELTRKIVNRQHGIQQAVDQMEESKPSAGLSKKEKSKVVKQAKAGKDIGKPGKQFKDVAAKAAKEYGSKEKGEKVAAAAMWKNIKEEAELQELSTKKYKQAADAAERAKNAAIEKFDDAEHHDNVDAADQAMSDYKRHKKAQEFASKKVAMSESVELSDLKKLSGL